MKNFKHLKIWEVGMEIAKQSYLISNQLPTAEKYGIKSQLTRAAISIPSNIAEGSSRESDKDYKRFLGYALGSSYEVETLLLVIKYNELLIDDLEINKLLEILQEEQKMIMAFQKRLQ